MVGLSIVLESLRSSGSSNGGNKKNPQVINKTIMITNHLPQPPPTPFVAGSVCFPVTSFLDSCYLCSQKLVPGIDIYMYKGDRAFCSEECRYRHIYTEEKESLTMKKKRTSSETNKIAKNPPPPSSTPISAAAPPPPKFRNYHHHQHHRNPRYITSVRGGI